MLFSVREIILNYLNNSYLIYMYIILYISPWADNDTWRIRESQTTVASVKGRELCHGNEGLQTNIRTPLSIILLYNFISHDNSHVLVKYTFSRRTFGVLLLWSMCVCSHENGLNVALLRNTFRVLIYSRGVSSGYSKTILSAV